MSIIGGWWAKGAVRFGGMTPVCEIRGDRSLPPGFRHPHASEEARVIAETGMLLRVQVGSGVHGTSITGQDDRDEMGICLEPARFVTGLARVRPGSMAGMPRSSSSSSNVTPCGTGPVGWRTVPGRAIWTW